MPFFSLTSLTRLSQSQTKMSVLFFVASCFIDFNLLSNLKGMVKVIICEFLGKTFKLKKEYTSYCKKYLKIKTQTGE